MLYNGIPFERDDTDRYRLLSGDSTGYQEPGTKASSSVAVSSAFEQGALYRTPDYGSSIAYRFSTKRNRLVVLGCPVLGYLVDADDNYVTGCTSTCRRSQSQGDLPGQCTGESGCCQNTMPRALNNVYKPYILTLQKTEEPTRNVPDQQELPPTEPVFRHLDSTECQYVFVAEDRWINTNYSYRAFFNRTSDFAVPVVLDWAIRNVGSCDIAGRRARGGGYR
uniref:Wall-associated receptor kinase galacturonan-binding domain-containing protein n=1 Tax=Oryza glumipatula TaxID=40148 RepID=A0A0D9YZW9_9ORYZ